MDECGDRQDASDEADHLQRLDVDACTHRHHDAAEESSAATSCLDSSRARSTARAKRVWVLMVSTEDALVRPGPR